MSDRKVVIALDGSPQAEYAFDWFVSNFKRDEDYVIAVHCPELVTPPLAATPLTPMHSSALAWSEAINNQKEAIKALENKYVQKMHESNIKGKLKITEGHPGHMVVQTADEEHAAAIVMGTRGLGTIRRTIMGSQSDYVLHHAHCPVIICRKD